MAEKQRRRRRRHTGNALESAARISLQALIVGAPLLIAGRPGWAITILALVAAAVLALSVSSRAAVSTNRASLVLFGALAVGSLWTMLQALPLPSGLVEWLVPGHTRDIDATSLLFGVDAPSAWPLSSSPSQTRAAIVAGVTLLAVAVAASANGAGARTRDVARAVGIAGIAVALVTVGHEAIGADRVYGFYALPWRPSILSPLVNENHLAGFLAMTVPVQLGLALEAETQANRVGWVVGAALSAVVTVAVVSRGGFVGLVVGLVVLGVLLLRARAQKGGRRIARATLIAALVAALLSIGVTTYAIQEAWLGDWGGTTLHKVRLAIDGLDLLVDRPFFGVGRGAYSEAFVRLSGVGDRAEYAENLPIQWLVDWGVPVGAGLLGAMAYAWVSAVRGATSPVRIGAVAGVASIAVHDLVDFTLEELGPAIVAVALLASVLARPSTAPSDTRRGRASEGARWAIVALGALFAVAVGPAIDANRVRPTTERLETLAAAEERTEFAELLESAMRTHPSEPAFPLMAGYEGALHDDGRSMRWLNRAMVLAPGWAAPHLVAARLLARRGAFAQAWLEVREVERLRPLSGLSEGCIVLGASETAERAIDTFTREAGGAAYLDRLAATCAGASARARSEIDLAIADSGLPGPTLRAARAAADSADYDGALALLEDVSSQDVATALTRARALVALDRHADAITTLRAAVATDDRERQQVLEAVARAQAGSGEAEAMRETMSTLRGAAGSSTVRASAAMVLLGDLERGLGNTGRAIQAYEGAERLSRESLGLARVAAVSEELGNLRRAYQAHVELCRRRSAPTCPAAERLSGRGSER